jgi:hypothetical protein
VRATGALLHALAAAGARHPDLNLKNVLLVPRGHAGADPGDAYDAWVLDVDVMRVDALAADRGRAWALNERNLARLVRSLEKWRRARALPIADLELEALHAIARHGADAHVELVWRPGHNVGPS